MEVLCIMTNEAVVILDMKEIVESDGWNGNGTVGLPPVKRSIEFEEAGLPIAMGCLRFENNTLYMFGGEILTDKSYTLGGVNFGFGKPGYDVITLDLCDPNSKPTRVGKLNGPKILPIVFEFKSKIYIFSSMISSDEDNFEVWDPVTRKASFLPPPPSKFFFIEDYLVTERGVLLAVDDHEAAFFNIDDHTWENSTRRSKLNGLDLRNFQDFIRMHGVMAPGYSDVYLMYVGEGILTANLLEPPLYQTFNCYGDYMALNAGYHIQNDMSVIADYIKQGMGPEPRYTCALVPCMYYQKKKMRIIIDVFRVDKKYFDSSKRRILKGPVLVPRELFSFTSFKKQVYEFNFHKVRGNKFLPFVTDAFIWSLPQA